MAEKTTSIEIKTLLKNKRLVIGTDRTIKGLKRKKFEKVFLSSNCNDSVRKDIEYYSRISKFKVVNLKYSNEELGVVCKKPFSISVIGLLKEK